MVSHQAKFFHLVTYNDYSIFSLVFLHSLIILMLYVEQFDQQYQLLIHFFELLNLKVDLNFHLYLHPELLLIHKMNIFVALSLYSLKVYLQMVYELPFSFQEINKHFLLIFHLAHLIILQF